MAHSIQTYKGKSEIFNDLDLLIIINFAVETIHQMPEFANLRGMAHEWLAELHRYGPGIIDLKFDQLITSSAKVKDVVALLDLVFGQLTQYGELIPAGMLNNQLSSTKITFHDYKVSLISDALKRLRSLIIEV